MLSYNPKHPGIIKSISQRWLFEQWARACKGARMPRWGVLGIADIASCFEYMSMMRVEVRREGARFFIMGHGRKLEEMHGRSIAGRYLDEALPDSIRDRVLDVYVKAAELAAPVYTIARSTDARGREVWHERLILPFGEGRVSHVFAMLEPYSQNGSIERERMLVNAAPPAYDVRVRIDSVGYQPQR